MKIVVEMKREIYFNGQVGLRSAIVGVISSGWERKSCGGGVWKELIAVFLFSGLRAEMIYMSLSLDEKATKKKNSKS